MRKLTIVDEAEIVMRQRLWLPWYERYGSEFREAMFRYPIEQLVPPPEIPDEEAAICEYVDPYVVREAAA